jgi:hypothetical protein
MWNDWQTPKFMEAIVAETNGARRLRLEAIVASPPTKKCRATLELMEEMTRRFPDETRLDVYDLGRNWPATPTMSCLAEYKTWRVPSAYVNGRPISKAGAPDAEALDAKIREELAKGPDAWEK